MQNLEVFVGVLDSSPDRTDHPGKMKLQAKANLQASGSKLIQTARKKNKTIRIPTRQQSSKAHGKKKQIHICNLGRTHICAEVYGLK